MENIEEFWKRILPPKEQETGQSMNENTYEIQIFGHLVDNTCSRVERCT